MKQEVEPGLWASRLEVVGELASLINTTFDLDEIFQAAILKLQRVLEFRRASVVLVSDDRTQYYLHTLYDAARGGFVRAEGTYPLDRGLPGQAILTGEAMRVDEFVGTEGIRAHGESNISALIVPICVDEDVIGTLNLGGSTGTYTDEDLELAALLGRQVATSLHYSKLLATIDQQREALALERDRVESERTQLESMIDASDAAILMVADNRVVHANRGMAELLGLPREVILGAPMERINRVLARSFSDPADLSAQIAALRGAGSPCNDRVEFHFPRRTVCQRTVAPVHGPREEVVGHLVMYRDVTREAEAEAAKSEFVSLVSHELRTPLTSVKTSINLLTKGAAGTVSDKAQGLLEIALRNLDRLIRLVDDLLDLSRIESGRVVTKLEPVSLDHSAAQAVDAVMGFADERSVRIELRDSEAGTRVLADPDRLQQVIVNLLSNAIKFSPKDGRVGLRWWKQDRHAVIEISDEGPGIPADDLESIFDKFRQLERTATRKYGGAGLGLAISRAIVNQLSGELWAESEADEGSRFFVKIRLAHGAPEAKSLEVPAGGGPRSVLVVESNPDLQHVFQDLFQDEGWQVQVFSQGKDALERTQDGFSGVITVGLELEDMHGLEFLQRLRESPATVDVPALLVGPGGDATQAIAYGADGWLVGDSDLIAEAERLVAAPRRRVVLLIEDDPAVRVSLARGLRVGGFACLEAVTGEIGLGMARQRKPDLVITDYQVPGKDGLAVLRELRDDTSLADVPAILVTGHPNPDMAEETKSLRATLVPKPFAASAVIQQIEQLIGSP